MTNVYSNFRSNDIWTKDEHYDAAAVRQVAEEMRADVIDATKIKPGEAGFLGAWPEAQARGYARNTFAWSMFLHMYLNMIEKTKE